MQGLQGVQGLQGLSNQGVQGLQGLQGVQGLQGTSGPSTTINATDDISTTTLYPVMVGATGSDQTAKARSTLQAFAFNASTNTLSSANILVGTATSTDTAAQPLQVTGGAYVSGSVGIGTTNPTSALTVVGDVLVSGVVTATSFRGDGSQLTGITASGGGGGGVSISTNTTNQSQYIPYVTGTGTTTGLGVTTTGLVFNPSSNSLGIGTTNPTSTLTVRGNTLVSGSSTLGTVQISSGIVTATTGIVTYYGDGSKLTGITVAATSSQRTTSSFTATEGQTTFSVQYIPGYIDVYLNGSRLSSAEYTATNGTSIILSVGASLNDVIEIISISSLGTVTSTVAEGLTGTPNIVVGVVTATKYYGDASSLTGVGSLQILDRGTLVGTAITTINFGGVGFSSITSSSGISTIVFTGSQRTTSSFIATEGQTIFSCSYTQGAVDVYLNGSRLSSSEYTAIDGSTIILSVGASLNDIIEVVSYTSIGSLFQSTSQYSIISGISSSSVVSSGLTGTPNIVVGTVTATSINVGTVTATKYYGDGSSLTGIDGGSIQILDRGTLVGTAITAINFSGVGFSSITTSSGISTIVLSGSQRAVASFVATEGQTVFSCSYTPSAIDVYLNGSRLSSAEYTATDSSTVILSVAASLNDIIEVVSYTSIGSVVQSTSQYSATSGISTLSSGLTGTPNIAVGIVTATSINAGILTATSVNVGIVTATKYYGDGSSLTGISNGGTGSIQVLDRGVLVGTAITAINFNGSGFSSITSSSGISTIVFTGSQRTISNFTATEGQTVFSCTYAPSAVDVYLNGSRLSSVEYTALNGSTIILSAGTSLNDIIEVLSYTTVASISQLTSEYSTSAGVSSSSVVSQGLVGTPNIVVGIVTATSINVGTVTATSINAGIVTATKYYGDGSSLSGVGGGGSIQILDRGVLVGTAITAINFNGAGFSSITSSSGISTIIFTGSQRTVTSFIATEGQTVFSCSYSASAVDVYLNGSRLSSSEYTALNGSTIIFSASASLNDIIEVISYTTVESISQLTSVYSNSAGVSSSSVVSQGLTGIPNINVGIVTATSINVGTVTATKYYGDGSSLTGIANSSGTGSIQVLDRGVLVGTAITAINFNGVGFSSITSSSGISTIVLTGSQRTTSSFVATEGQTVFLCSYSASAVDVYLNGSRLSSSEYTALDGSTLILSASASLNDIIEVLSYTTVASISQLTSVYSNSAGVSSSSVVSQGLTGTPNIVVGIVTSSYINVGTVTATKYYGDGSSLTGIANSSGTGSIQIFDRGVLVGTAITAISFNGVGFSSITSSSGISTIVFTGSQRTVNTFTATEGQTNFSCSYAPTAVDVYLNGVRINSSEYIAVDGSTIILSVGASLNDIIEVVSFSSVGSISQSTSQYSTISGVSSSSLGLTGTPNINVGIVTATKYYGDGSTLSNVIAVGSQGSIVGSGVTFINFVGSGVSSIVFSSGIATVSVLNSQRTAASFVATAGQTVFTTNYTVGFVDVYKDGTRLTASQYIATNGTTIVLSSGATVGQVIDIVTVTNVSGNITSSDDTRIQSVSEKINITSGNTVSLVYNTGSGNIGLVTNPSGDITLNVTGIPVDSSFDSRKLEFSVIVTQTGTARSCTAITLNGVSRTIRWAGGSLGGAITRGGNTSNGYDIYNFIGINTVGSASTTANYIVLGSVNGNFS